MVDFYVPLWNRDLERMGWLNESLGCTRRRVYYMFTFKSWTYIIPILTLILAGCAIIPLDIELRRVQNEPKIKEVVKALPDEQQILFFIFRLDDWTPIVILSWFEGYTGSYPEEFIKHVKPMMQEEFKMIGSYIRDDLMDKLCTRYIKTYYTLQKNND